MRLLDKILGRGQVHGPDQPHKWEAIRRGFPQRVCRCGALHAPGGIKSGENSLTVSPAGAGDILRWSASGTPLAVGDGGLNFTDGALSRFSNGRARTMWGRSGLSARMTRWHQVRGVSSLIDSFGEPAPTARGAASQGSSSPYNPILYNSAALNGDMGWISASFANGLDISGAISAIFLFGMPSNIGAIRYFVGLTKSDPMGSATPTDFVGIRYDTGVDGTAFWRTYVDKGGVNSETTTTIPVGASEQYGLLIEGDTIAGTFLNISLCQFANPTQGVVMKHLVSIAESAQPVGALGWVSMMRNLDAVSRSPRQGMVKLAIGPIEDKTGTGGAF